MLAQNEPPSLHHLSELRTPSRSVAASHSMAVSSVLHHLRHHHLWRSQTLLEMKSSKPTPRKRAPGGGRKPLPVKKVRLECRVLPQTKRALGDKPGEKLDRIVSNVGGNL